MVCNPAPDILHAEKEKLNMPYRHTISACC